MTIITFMRTKSIMHGTPEALSQLGWIRFRTWSRMMGHAPCCPAEVVRRLWNDPDSLIADGIPLRNNHGVRTLALNEIGGAKVVVKRYVERSWRHAIKGFVLPSRAEQAVRNTLAVAAAGIPTPAPLAYRSCLWGALQQPVSYFLYEYLEGQTLGSFLQSPMVGPQLIERLATQSRTCWKILADKGLLLHDPSQSNFLVDRDAQLWVIDLDKLERHPVSTRFQQLADDSLGRFLRFQSSRRGETTPVTS